MVNPPISVYYHGEEAAVISYDEERLLGYLEYTPAFLSRNIALAPLLMPGEARKVYSFPTLNPDTFRGLPGMVADSLPDKFGNSVLNQWWARQGRRTAVTPIERLQFTGTRGMGALEYRPSTRLKRLNSSEIVELALLTELAQSVVHNRQQLGVPISTNQRDPQAMKALLAVGTSAGGARPKAVLAFNQDFTEARSGQVSAPEGFTHYLMKFDGVVENSPDRETFGDPLGYGAMEYVYYLMATRCGIDMEECFLLNEGPRRHFISKRFDRDGNKKIHTQTLTAIAHVDYNTPGSFSYEELFATARELKLPVHDARQLFIRMSFNMLTRNNDDHSKNFSFVYRHKSWRLSPAYDVAYCYKANNAWVERHWMPANGKRIDHNRGDLISVGRNMTRIPVSELHQLIDEVIESVNCWDALALEYEVPADLRKEISDNLPISDFKK